MRVETGAVQFGDDWPGLFIRGDNALAYALDLKHLLDDCNDPGREIECINLDGLAGLLMSCRRRPDMKVQKLPDQATFAALVEVARAVNGFVHHSGGCRTYIGKKCDCGAAKIYDSLSRLRNHNPKLLEDGR